MTLQVQKQGEQFVLVLSEEQMQAAGLSEGDSVSIWRASDPQSTAPIIHYATDEEMMRAFESTLERYDAVYRELAK